MSHQKGIDIKELAQMNQCFDTVGWITNVHLACKNLYYLSPKIIFQNSAREVTKETWLAEVLMENGL